VSAGAGAGGADAAKVLRAGKSATAAQKMPTARRMLRTQCRSKPQATDGQSSYRRSSCHKNGWALVFLKLPHTFMVLL